MERLLAIYQAGGFLQAAYEITQIVSQGTHHMLVNVRWTLTRKQQGPWIFQTGYNLRQSGDGWKILVCIVYEERQAREIWKAPAENSNPPQNGLICAG